MKQQRRFRRHQLAQFSDLDAAAARRRTDQDLFRDHRLVLTSAPKYLTSSFSDSDVASHSQVGASSNSRSRTKATGDIRHRRSGAALGTGTNTGIGIGTGTGTGTNTATGSESGGEVSCTSSNVALSSSSHGGGGTCSRPGELAQLSPLSGSRRRSLSSYSLRRSSVIIFSSSEPNEFADDTRKQSGSSSTAVPAMAASGSPGRPEGDGRMGGSFGELADRPANEHGAELAAAEWPQGQQQQDAAADNEHQLEPVAGSGAADSKQLGWSPQHQVGAEQVAPGDPIAALETAKSCGVAAKR